MNLKLYSFRICPFVERINILLLEKQIECEKIIVDIRNKPNWFLEISPLGKVPILQVDKTIIFESSVINEFLDEISSESLHPNSAVTKAYNRSWIEWSHSLIADAYYMTLSATQEDFIEKKNNVQLKLDTLNTELKNKPFFNGDKFCMIDLAFAPIFKRFDVLKRQYKIDLLENYPQLIAWSNSILDRKSVKLGFANNFDEEFEQLLSLKKSFLAQSPIQNFTILALK